MMMHILIPTDFSENATNAINYALCFFKDTKATFYLLHVSFQKTYEESECYYKLSDTAIDEQVIYHPAKQLQEQLKKLKKNKISDDHHFIAVHEQIHFIDSVRKQVADKAIDFIVMGTKGGSQVNPETLGSHTGEVITKVKCPILVIPEAARYEKVEKVLFPTDFHMVYNNRILHTLTDVLELKQSQLDIVYMGPNTNRLSPSQKRNRVVLKEYFNGNVSAFSCHTNERMEDAIERLVKQQKAQMIAMVAKNLNFFHRLLFRPAVKSITYHTRIPFLILHE